MLQGQNEFQFVYVPYDSQNLIGGHIDGATGNANLAAGQSKFNLAKTASGRYALSVLESDGTTKLTEDDGVLMLSVADTFDSDPTVGSEAILSYEYDPGSGNFVIEARALVNVFSGTPNGGFLNEFQLKDTDFYFAWIDFDNPLAPPLPLDGDYNGDGTVNAADYAVWRDDLGSTTNLAADGDGDGTVDPDDYAVWRDNFGATRGVNPAAPVPEPTTLALVLIGAVVSTGLRRPSRGPSSLWSPRSPNWPGPASLALWRRLVQPFWR